MAVLEINGLKKSFGSQSVLDNVSFSVEKGSVYGFIGKNGAGKTTTMNIALGLLKADEGQIKINDQIVSYGDTRTNQFVGYLPDVPEFYTFLTAREYMELCVEISGLDKKKGKEKVTELLEMVGLEDNRKRIKNYSRGMKQRLGIAQALINEPLLLICDEPTSALDPIGRQQLLSVLQKVKEQTTVIFSTHILSDVEAICNEVAILNNGRIVRQGTVKQLKAEISSEKWIVILESEEDAEVLSEVLTGEKQLKAVVRTGSVIEGETTDAKAAIALILQNLNRLSLVPVKVERKEATMEEVFMEAIR